MVKGYILHCRRGASCSPFRHSGGRCLSCVVKCSSGKRRLLRAYGGSFLSGCFIRGRGRPLRLAPMFFSGSMLGGCCGGPGGCAIDSNLVAYSNS